MWEQANEVDSIVERNVAGLEGLFLQLPAYRSFWLPRTMLEGGIDHARR
jgi:hypothetical protein